MEAPAVTMTRSKMAWWTAKRRCSNRHDPDYPAYGGRGIEMRFTYKELLAHIGEKPMGHVLDRIDNAGHYEPGNVRWATMKEHCRNRATTPRLTIGDRTMALSEWAELAGITGSTLRHRIRSRDWTLEQAVGLAPPPKIALGRRASTHCARGHFKEGKSHCAECSRAAARRRYARGGR